ncbi:hypothetical protein MKA43_23345, partial [[Clostridium] innocuum]|nr:hypothetical protein [[Clostridium] innocuum]MCR0189845.1 hypothetical protein [[Clostridium] innocuum]
MNLVTDGCAFSVDGTAGVLPVFKNLFYTTVSPPINIRVSKIFGGLNFRGQFRGLNFEGHFRGINPKRNRWHSSVSFSIMFYWLC